MFALPIATCFWPGLARLWFRGDWSGLAAAVLFATALNLLLMSSFLWPELLPVAFGWIGWPLLLTVWLASAVRTYGVLPELRQPTRRIDVGLFIQAQDEYLKGHWFEAESLLRRLIADCQHDVPAQLLLATLYRRTRRLDEAERRLQTLERLDGATYWGCEIQHERELLQCASARKIEPPDDASSADEPATVEPATVEPAAGSAKGEVATDEPASDPAVSETPLVDERMTDSLSPWDTQSTNSSPQLPANQPAPSSDPRKPGSNEARETHGSREKVPDTTSVKTPNKTQDKTPDRTPRQDPGQAE